ncbi:hypothetical protein N7494_011391 [Penicillium frequentans]|uniref:Uncharacterized protein n=1 Tax=Penicillium frequentans TaxID=3151616 RepID=A0AAD6CJN4_9EURO|nr:hypothetical protein N7494_011391 [Penicillium glabrum]
MPLTGLTPEGFLAGGTRMMQAGLEGAKVVATYSKPALEKAANLTAEAFAWSVQNPTPAAWAGLGITGAFILAAPGLVTAPALSIIGVLGNIKAASVFAVARSSIGNIVAGSPMAIVQSAGAGGSGLAVVNGVAQLGGAAMAAGSATLAWFHATL